MMIKSTKTVCTSNKTTLRFNLFFTKTNKNGKMLCLYVAHTTFIIFMACNWRCFVCLFDSIENPFPPTWLYKDVPLQHLGETGILVLSLIICVECLANKHRSTVNHFRDLAEIRTHSFIEPLGWYISSHILVLLLHIYINEQVKDNMYIVT